MLKEAPTGIAFIFSLKTAHFEVEELYQTPRGELFDTPAEPGGFQF